ncbi:MAG TPA: hypothetical protein VG826_22690 [Pirellulales bacterium]|nr:hypothetical protein [Pirellulales bacterium]
MGKKGKKSRRKRKNKSKPSEAGGEEETAPQDPESQLPSTVGAKADQDTGQGQTASQPAKEKRRWQKPPVSQEWLKFAEVLCAGAIVIFAAIAQKNAQDAAKSAEATVRQARADSEKIQKLVNETGVKFLRAYVSVQPGGVEPSKKPDELKATINIVNNGMTRAHKIAMRSNALLAPLNYSGEFVTMPHPTRNWLGPSDNFLLMVSVPASETQRKALKDGELVLWVYGRIEYKDDYKGDRYTEFRYYWDGQNETFNFANNGNQADEWPEESDANMEASHDLVLPAK